MRGKLLLVAVILSMLACPVSALKYYAYGDSITKASGYCGFASDGSDSYVNKLSGLTGATPERNTDGGGRTSAWGVENMKSHISQQNDYDYVFIFFGNNDLRDKISGIETGKNIESIYRYVEGTGAVPIIMLPTIMNTTTRDNYSIQGKNIRDEERHFDSIGVRYFRTYDTMDKNKNNGIPDEADPNALCDTIHPTKEIHANIAAFIISSKILQNYVILPIPEFVRTAPLYNMAHMQDKRVKTNGLQISTNKDVFTGDTNSVVIVRVRS